MPLATSTYASFWGVVTTTAAENDTVWHLWQQPGSMALNGTVNGRRLCCLNAAASQEGHDRRIGLQAWLGLPFCPVGAMVHLQHQLSALQGRRHTVGVGWGCYRGDAATHRVSWMSPVPGGKSTTR